MCHTINRKQNNFAYRKCTNCNPKFNHRLKKMKKVNRNQIKTAVVIVALFIIGTLLNIPFSRELKRIKIKAGDTSVNLLDSISEEIIQTSIYGLIVGAILVFVGLFLSKKAELGAPLIESIFSKEKIKEFSLSQKNSLLSIVFSVILAVVILILHKLVRDLYPVTSIIDRPSKIYYVIVSFSAGITEEIMFRLGLMSLIITVIQLFKKKVKPSNSVVWVSIIITAIFFGLIHLPLSQNFSKLSTVTVSATMIGNLITGSFFGYVYWKRGLLVAITSHIIWDLVFHVVGSPYL